MRQLITRDFWQHQVGSIPPVGRKLLNALSSLVILCFILAIGIIVGLGYEINTQADRHQVDLLKGAIKAEHDGNSKFVDDNARWDSLVENSYGNFNYEWAETNLVNNFYTFVLTNDGKMLYSSGPKGVAGYNINIVAPEAVRILLERLPRDRDAALDIRQPITQLGMLKGAPAFFTAMPIIPFSEAVSLNEPPRYLVAALPIDQATIKRWAEIYQLEDLTMTLGEGLVDEHGLSLTDPTGRQLAALRWNENHPLQDALERLAFMLLLGFGTFLILSAIVVRRALTVARSLAESSEVAALSDELGISLAEAQTARDAAEAAHKLAVLQAEQAAHAHQVAAEAATSERAAREQHNAALLNIAVGFDRSVAAVVDAVYGHAAQLERAASKLAGQAIAASSQASVAAHNAQHASQSVEIVATAAEELSTAISMMTAELREQVSLIDAANSSSREGDEAMHKLEDSANDIGTMVEAIMAIAKQTNLLSLNATIEAARAGEAGRGFAVVAGEVKGLASKAGQAATQIGDLLNDVHSRVGGAVDSFGRVAERVVAANSIALTVFSTVSQQQQATETISNQADEAAKGVALVNQAAAEVAGMAEATEALAEEVRHAITELHSQADLLKQAAQDFTTQLKAA
jgi:hypothetical protein